MVEESRNQPVPGHPRSSHERAEAGRADLSSPPAGGRVVLNELWRELPSGRVPSASLAASTGEVVLAESEGRVTCYDVMGVQRWTFDCGAADPRVAVTAEGKRTAVLAGGTLWWLDAQGQVLWHKPNLTGLVVVAASYTHLTLPTN